MKVRYDKKAVEKMFTVRQTVLVHTPVIVCKLDSIH